MVSTTAAFQQGYGLPMFMRCVNAAGTGFESCSGNSGAAATGPGAFPGFTTPISFVSTTSVLSQSMGEPVFMRCLNAAGTGFESCQSAGGGGGTPAGPNFAVQFDSGGVLGGSSDFLFTPSPSGGVPYLQFNGSSNDGVATASSDFFPAQFTFEGWIAANASPHADWFGPVSGDFGWHIRDNTGISSVAFSYYDGSTNVTLNGINTWTAGTFHHVAATYDGTTFRLWEDGVLADQTTSGSAISFSNKDFYFAHNPGFSTWGDGSLRQVRVSNVARYAAPFTPALSWTPDGNTIAYWPVVEGSGTTVADTSGNGHAITLQGSPLPTWGSDVLSATLALVGDMTATNYYGNGSFLTGIETGVCFVGNGTLSVLCQGSNNAANGQNPTVGGGDSNTADTDYSTISGGQSNYVGGSYGYVGGGGGNQVFGQYSTVGGGTGNEANGDYESLLGGANNSTTDNFSSVLGGEQNTASGAYSVVLGGFQNTTTASNALAAGNQATAGNKGSFVWADSQLSGYSDNGSDTFNVRSQGGAYFRSGSIVLSNPSSDSLTIAFGGGSGSDSYLTPSDGLLVIDGDLNVLDKSTFTQEIYLSSAMVTYGAPGNPGDILVSSGPGRAPIWTKPTTISLQTYFMQNAASDITGFKQMNSTGAASISTLTVSGLASGNVIISTWATIPLVPNAATIPPGIITVETYAAQTAGTKVSALYAELWEINATGTLLNLIGTTGPTLPLTGSKVNYSPLFILPTPFTFAALTSRLMVRWIVSTTGGGSAPTVAMYYGNGNDSNVSLPFTTADLAQFVPYNGANQVLNLGSNNLTTTSSASFGTAASPTTNVMVYGVLTSSTPVPSISCSAGTGVLSTDSTNAQGQFVAGAAAANCTVTFNATKAWPKKPKCWCNDETNIVVIQAITTATTLKCSAAVTMSNDTLTYGCQGAP